MSFIQHLKRNLNKYPYSTINDLLKLIFQSEFAGGHMIESKEKSLKYLNYEVNNIDIIDNILYEYISSEIIRINLDSYLFNNLDLNVLNDIFYNSANLLYNGKNIKHKCNLLKQIINYDHNIINEFSNNPKPFHHSEIYRIKYNPHYRVINSNFLPLEFRYLKLSNFINSIKQDKLTIIAVEGKATSGKTTLVNMLKDVTIIHADDFFSKEDVLDFKLIKELISKLEINKSISYTVYDCSTDIYYEKYIDVVKPIVIIEGVYSYHNILRQYYDYLIYFEVNKDNQNFRIINRCSNNDYLLNKFIHEWIPRENKYYDEENLILRADLII